MSQKDYVNVPLYQIFDFSVGTNSGLTRSFVNTNKGPIPVFGASKEAQSASYGHIKDNLPGIKYFENCLTYNKDGANGHLFYREGRFCLSEKVVPLMVFPQLAATLDYSYLKYYIEEIKGRIDYTYSNKATKLKFKDLVVPIPVREDGDFDLDRQKELSDRYRQVEEQRAILLHRLETLENMLVVLPQEASIRWTYVTPGELSPLPTATVNTQRPGASGTPGISPCIPAIPRRNTPISTGACMTGNISPGQKTALPGISCITPGNSASPATGASFCPRKRAKMWTWAISNTSWSPSSDGGKRGGKGILGKTNTPPSTPP